MYIYKVRPHDEAFLFIYRVYILYTKIPKVLTNK